jgi:hypothetical protein
VKCSTGVEHKRTEKSRYSCSHIKGVMKKNTNSVALSSSKLLPIKEYREVEVYIHPFLNLSLDRG